MRRHWQPVKCIDAAGKTRYVDQSLTSDAKCKPVEAQINVVPPQDAPSARARDGSATEGAGRKAAARPGPVVDPRAAQQARLAEAERKLEAANKALAEQEDMRSGGERNYARALERQQPYKDEVERQRQVVEQLRREAR